MPTNIQKYDFKEGLPQEFEVIDLEHLFAEFSEELTHSHRANFYQLIWFKDGFSTHTVDFNPIQTRPNTLLFVNKNSVQRFDSKAKVTGKLLLFTDDFFCKTDSDTRFLRGSILFNDLLSISVIRIKDDSTTFSSIFHQIEEEFGKAKDFYQSDILRNLLENLLLLSEREHRKQDFTELKKDANLEYVLLYKDLVDKHYITQKQVSFYCQKMHLTSKRLNQATSKVFGKTPKELIDERILLEAKRILSHTTDSVKEVGFSLGFDEPTNFIKYFRKHTHKTPIEFREEFILD